MRELLLEFKDFLRKRVDFGVLFFYLFCQRFELGGLSRFRRIRRGGLRRSGAKRNRDYRPENDRLHRSEILPPADLSDKWLHTPSPEIIGH
jgi:hypothetical protein